MKKCFLAVFLLILAFVNVYAQAPIIITDLHNTIKVGLFYNSTALESLTLSYDGQSITVGKDDITDDKVYISEEGVIKVNDKAYRGSIIIKRIDGGNLTVINEVDMEDYVAAVVSKEMSPSFELEALKTQAVCARTYATANLNKHSKYGFDVCSTADCQVYAGKDAEHENTIKAAKETNGELLTYNGKIAETVYFATSGGYTEDAKYVWGTDIPYLKGVSDEYESKECYASTWKKELSPKRATEILTGKGYEIGNVQKIEVVGKTDNGSVYKLKVIGDKGEKIFSDESCRTLFGYDILLSQAYTVSQISGISITAYGGNANIADLHILSANGMSVYNETELHMKGAEDKMLSTPMVSDAFVFSGRGNGHLVGMSQNGANGMAKAGFTYDKILSHYYTGTELVQGSI